MSAVLFVLFFVVAALAVALLAAMCVKGKTLYGVAGLCVLVGPAVLLAFGYLVAVSD